jgi:4-amino-4-deoxy-L-arabinose transferase-like glycosyltransferase
MRSKPPSVGSEPIANGLIVTLEAISLRYSPLPVETGSGLGRALRWLSGSHWRALAALTLLALLSFLPGLASIPPIDRDEARFVQSTKQMLETGNYVDIRFQEGTRYKKPIGIYWLQAAAVKLTGHGADAPIWAYRIASVAGALAAVLLTYWACLPLFGRTAGFVAAALLAVSVVLVVEAHSGKTDAVLLATVVLTEGALARLYLWDAPGRPPLGIALLFWAGLGLGILVKGPIVLMVAGLTIVGLLLAERRARWLLGLRPAIGLPVMLAIVLPWFVAILAIAGGDFLGQSGHDLLGKLANGQEGHAAPPGTHALVFWLAFAPGAALLPAAAAWIWRQRITPAVTFCLAWFIPSFLAFEAVVTKLPHYPLPTYPAVAALIGGAVASGGLATNWTWGRVPAISAAAGTVLVALVALVVIDRFGGGIGNEAVIAALLVVAFAVAAMVPAWNGAPAAAVALLVVATPAFYFLILGVAVPGASRLLLTPRLAAAIAANAPCAQPRVASAGYEEASLVFTVGTGVIFVDGAGAADFLQAPGCRVALVDERSAAAFLARAERSGFAVQKRAAVEGVNLGRVNTMRIGLYTRANPG